MALTESVQLDIQAAQRQIDTLEAQLSDLSTPISVPVSVQGGQQLSQIRSELALGEDAAAGLAGELDQADTALRDTGQSAGQAGDQLEDAGRRGASTFGRLATVVGGIITALGVRGLFGAIVGAGFDRFTDIENATRALTIQLDSAATAATLLDDVLDVVTGTPFNFDQFAQGAQQLAGFGVEIERIPGILTAIGEAAATQGDRAPEFVDRLVTVFGQITTSGRVALEDINRIADTGVNALLILANAFDVTTEEMRDMISEGAVPAAEAIDILTDGIVQGSEGAAGATVALGGTMEGLRETLTGAIGGLRSAAARLGEAFFELIGASSVEGVNALTEAVDLITASVQNLEEVDVAVVARNIAGLPSAIGTTFTQIGAGAETVGNAIQVFNDLIQLNFAEVGTQFSQLGDDIQRFREAGVGNTAIQNLITTLAGGAEPAEALNAVLVELGQNVSSLTVESFEALATQLVGMAEAAGLSGPEVSDLIDDIERFGQEAGFSAPGIQILIDLLDELRLKFASELTPAEEAARAFFAGVSEGATGAASGLSEAGDDVESFAEQVSRIRAGQIAEELEGIGDVFDALPDEMDAAAEAMRDAEGEIVTDFSDFLENLETEIETQQRFRTGLAILDAMGLPLLAQAFADAGEESSTALWDAIDNPAEARAAEAALVAEAQAIGDATLQALTDVIEAADLDLTIGADASIAINSLRIFGLEGAAAQALVGGQQRRDVGGVGSPGADQNLGLTQIFEGFTPTDTDLARAAQSVNAIVVD